MKKGTSFKRATGLLVVIVMIFSSLGMVFANTVKFTDIEGHWAKDQILESAEMDIVRGYGDTFKPDNNITRAEFMSLMNKTFFEYITDEEVAEADIVLADVKEDAWYAGIVKKAVVAGYISGYGDGVMKPEAHITRQEVAAIFSKVFELEQNDEAVEVFTDLESIASWAKGHVGAVAENRFMTGYTEGEVRSFKGNQNITRAEAVVALDKVITVIFEDIFDGIFDEDFDFDFDFDADFDFESIFEDMTIEELQAIFEELQPILEELQPIFEELFGDSFTDLLEEEFWSNLEDLTEEELEVLFEEIFANFEETLNNLTEEEMDSILERIFEVIFGDFGDMFEDYEDMFEGLSEEEIEAILEELLGDL